MKNEDLIINVLEALREDLKEFKKDVNRRFEQVDKQFEQIREEIRDVKYELRSDKKKLDDVYEAREKVKITSGWQWGMVSLFIAIAVGAIV